MVEHIVTKRFSDSGDCTGAGKSFTTAFGCRTRVKTILVHLSASVSPTITVTISSKDGTNYNTLIKSTTLSSEANFFYTPDLFLEKGDELIVAVGAAAATAYITVIAEDHGKA